MSVDGHAIVKALGGHWHGRQGMARCPAHKDGTPSLHVTEKHPGLVLLRCFGGCDQGAVIEALRSRGLWPERTPEGWAARRKPLALAASPDEPDEDELARMREARAIWAASRPIAGTLAETYLRARAVRLKLPPTLRFHPGLYHSGGHREVPALIGALQNGAGRITAVQRIYLRADGQTKAAVDPAKMTKGPMGRGAVRLGRPRRILGIAEGIETALSASELFSLPVWACLGANRLGAIEMPESVEQVVIFADNGEVGMREAEKAAVLYDKQGLAAVIEQPPVEHKDWNDVMQARRRVAA